MPNKSIDEYIVDIETCLADIRKALLEKEVTAPTTLKVSEIPTYINKIGA